MFVHIDNMAAVAIINRGSCKQPMVMACLRRIFWLSAVFCFRRRAVYYPGDRNVLADAASRLHEPGGGPRRLSLLASMPHQYQQCVNSPPLISVNKRLPLIQKRVTAPTETPFVILWDIPQFLLLHRLSVYTRLSWPDRLNITVLSNTST